MKPGHLVITIATITIFLTTFLIANGFPTGFLTALDQPINLQVGNIEVHDTTAVIRWTTDADVLSVLDINNEQIAFSTAQKFSKLVTGLEPGTAYEYVIRACDTSDCEERNSIIVTNSGPVARAIPAITGAAISVDGVIKVLQTSVNLILYSLIVIVLTIIGVRIAYDKFSSRNQIEGVISNAKKLIQEEQYDEANRSYAQARKAFTELAEEAKLKHYDDLLRIYSSLKKHTELKEAQNLAEKYSDGTITQEELRRLNDLIAS